MKRIFLLNLLLGFTLAMIAQDLNVMSFNIRLNIASDSLNAWPYRKDYVASQVLFHEIHILGVQEALHDQMLDLKSRLNKFSYAGGGRDDGKTKGEYSAIFYDTSRLQLLGTQTFWLSLTPEIPGSKSWDAAITRIVTWSRFKDRKTKMSFYVFNTHFDHMGQTARKESAGLLKNKVAEIAGQNPVIIMGDFNAPPTEESIKRLVDKSDHFQFTDTKELSETPHYGPTGTFNGFGNKEKNDQPIDYIFTRGEKWKVRKHATISQTWGGRFASDHFAVMAVMGFRK
ncbi:MAG TPA: endonuclease/exonuclease/phosphatase family protein [Chitinophagaceae bacterium]|nr:endonuclease/exonuclease/phosphatase family protein [Chitinophagaceae bacterium]